MLPLCALCGEKSQGNMLGLGKVLFFHLFLVTIFVDTLTINKVKQTPKLVQEQTENTKGPFVCILQAPSSSHVTKLREPKN